MSLQSLGWKAEAPLGGIQHAVDGGRLTDRTCSPAERGTNTWRYDGNAIHNNEGCGVSHHPHHHHHQHHHHHYHHHRQTGAWVRLSKNQATDLVGSDMCEPGCDVLLEAMNTSDYHWDGIRGRRVTAALQRVGSLRQSFVNMHL